MLNRIARLWTTALTVVVAMVALAGLNVSAVRADIVDFGGDVVVMNPPANIGNNNWSSFTTVRAWFERRTELAADLTVNNVATGMFAGGGTQVQGTIPAGTIVKSHMIRFDPGGNNGVTRSGFVVFSDPIIGVIATTGFNSTDTILGSPGVTYNQNNNRGMELNANEYYTISEDRRRIDFVMIVTNAPTDEIRVVTSDGSQLSGACCTGIACGVIAANACSGTFRGPDTACTPFGDPDNRTTCCAANFNGQGGVTVQDVFDYLQAFFAGTPTADFNGSGAITVQDVFDLLAGFFNGCL